MVTDYDGNASRQAVVWRLFRNEKLRHFVKVRSFRVWDGALVSFTAAGLFNLILRADRPGVIDIWNLSAIAVLLSFLFFLNPNIGIAAGAATVVLIVRRFDLRRTLVLLTISGLALLMIVAPWTIRNQRELGAMIMLRSNAGIELAIANYEGALRIGDPVALYRDRLEQIHPFSSTRAAEKMKRTGGEVIYSRWLGDESVSWIILHPKDFAQLYVTHVLNVLFPQPWQFSLFGGGPLQSMVRSHLCALLSIGSFLSMAAAYRRRDVLWLYPACFLMIPALIYGIFQPVPRYTYLIYCISALMAADGFLNLAKLLIGLLPINTRVQSETT